MTSMFRSLAVRSLLALALTAGLAAPLAATSAARAQDESESEGGTEEKPVVIFDGGTAGGEVVAGENIIGQPADPNKTYMFFVYNTQSPGATAHLLDIAALQRRFKDDGLVAVGISGEPKARVRSYLTAQAGLSNLIMIRSNIEGLDQITKGVPMNLMPVSLMQKGKYVWRGTATDPSFPLSLAVVLSGRYDPEILAKGQPAYRAALDAIKLKNFRDAYRHFDTMMSIDQKVFGEAAIMKYVSMIRDAKDAAGARKWGEEVLVKYADDRVTLMQLATTIMTSDDIKERDAELAMKAVDALATQLSATSPRVLRLRASILAALGKFQEAQELQYEAWLAAEPADKADNKRLLDAYRRRARELKTSGSGSESGVKSGATTTEEAPASGTP
jgi:hypothetical protein